VHLLIRQGTCDGVRLYHKFPNFSPLDLTICLLDKLEIWNNATSCSCNWPSWTYSKCLPHCTCLMLARIRFWTLHGLQDSNSKWGTSSHICNCSWTDTGHYYSHSSLLPCFRSRWRLHCKGHVGETETGIHTFLLYWISWPSLIHWRFKAFLDGSNS